MSALKMEDSLIHHHGTSQAERDIKALDPLTIPVDDREIQHLLRYLWELAAELNYFSSDDSKPKKTEFVDGNWRDFLSVEPAFRLAMIATEPKGEREKNVRALGEELQTENDDELRSDLIENVFLSLFGYANEIDQWIKSLHGWADLQQIFRRMVNDRFTPLIKNLINTFCVQRAPLSKENLDRIDQLKKKLAINDEDIIIESDGQAIDDDELVKELFNVWELILAFRCGFQNRALSLMHLELKKEGVHKPHIALLLTFLSLLQKNRDQLNRFTTRHLDYCFKEVLLLKNQKEKPDSTYLLFELDPAKEQAIIPKGTRFKAGQDIHGKDLEYCLEERFIVNRAQVTELKHLYLDHQPENVHIHAGEIIITGDTPFSLFGGPELAETKVGFAVCSPILRLSSGQRTIWLTLALKLGDQTFPAEMRDIGASVHFQLSGPEDWVTPHSEVELVEKEDHLKLKVELNLAENESPIVNNTLLAGLDTPYPVLRCLINSDLYPLFNHASLEECDLKVSVTSAKDFFLQTENGLVEPEEPFMPFGQLPMVGASLLVGSQELFEKKIDTLTLNWSWCDFPSNFKAYYACYDEEDPIDENTFRINCLSGKNGGWHNHTEPDGKQLPFPDGLSDSVSLTLENVTKKFQELPIFSEYASNLKNGFLKLEFSSPDGAFGHKSYPELFQKWEVDKALLKAELQIVTQDLKLEKEKKEKRSFPGKILHFIFDSISQRKRQKRLEAKIADLTKKDKLLESKAVNPPYTPVFSNFSLDYESSVSIDVQANQIEDSLAFLHITPFGFQQYHLKTGRKVSLCPRYTAEGCLFIGIQNAQPGQKVSLLFFCAPESGDPFAPEPAEIEWSYWSKKGWGSFGPEAGFTDETRYLVGSGLVGFILPSDIATGNTALNPDLHWIKAEIKENSPALPKFYGVHAQAARVVFKNNENDLAHLASGLPAEQIKDIPPEISNRKSSIIKILQPYSSFDGKPPEQNPDLYKRSAERLSHKGQAVIIRDYERLVLEHFPEIYRVKCLNHTTLDLSPKPGHVTLVVIPELDNPLILNPFTPGASYDLMRRIKRFLQTKMSHFVTLHVRNPIYESIRIESEVVYNDGVDRFYAERELQEGLKKLLSPWAFSGKSIVIGNTVHRSRICAFFEESPSVRFLDPTKLIIKRCKDDEEAVIADEQITGQTAASILYSASKHQLKSHAMEGGQ